MFVPVTTPEEMTRWDSLAVSMGVPEAVLMENAAREAFFVLRYHYGTLRGARVLILAGSGNNGGDALCLARHLSDAGALPVIMLTGPPKSNAARLQFGLVRDLGLPLFEAGQQANTLEPALESGFPHILVDGLLGTGFRGPLRPAEADLVRHVNALGQRCLRLALDIPSGLDAMSGLPRPAVIRADVTVAFEAAKPGLVLPHARQYTGLVEVRPIGMPALARRTGGASYRVWLDADGDETDPYRIGRDAFRPMEPVRKAEGEHGRIVAVAEAGRRLYPLEAHGPAHKGESGKVLIVGGSPGLSGAARIAAMGALRGGAGLICVAAPETSIADVRLTMPEAITLGLEEQKTHWPDHIPDAMLPFLQSYDAIVAGPGMGRNNGSAKFLEALLLKENRPPAVFDADALQVFAREKHLLSLVRRNDVLTPHPGEAASLLGVSANKVQEDRLGSLQKLAELAQAVWVLKGAGTVIYIPGQPVVLSALDVPALAVGGSGDVLSGVIGALIAGQTRFSGLEERGRGPAPAPHDAGVAAVLGMRIHALAGLLLEERNSWRGHSPLDIANALPAAAAGMGNWR